MASLQPLVAAALSLAGILLGLGGLALIIYLTETLDRGPR
jgi:hypothetical protein